MRRGFGDVEREWNQFLALPFPSQAYDLFDSEVVEIDTFSAGCIDTYLKNKGILDRQRIDVLRKCKEDLQPMIGELDGETREYFHRLFALCEIVLANVDES